MKYEIPVVGYSELSETNGVATASFFVKCSYLAQIAYSIKEDKYLLSTDGNIRVSLSTEPLVKTIYKSLVEDPVGFRDAAGTLLFTAKNVKRKVSKNGKSTIVALDMPNETEDERVAFSVVDGGHRLKAICKAAIDRVLSPDALVHIEVLFGDGVTRTYTEQLSVKRNIQQRVKVSDIANAMHKYDLLKEMLCDTTYENSIEFKTNQQNTFIKPGTVATVFRIFSKFYNKYDRKGRVMFLNESAYRSSCGKNTNVKFINNRAEHFKQHKEYFISILDMASNIVNTVSSFAVKHPNTRLDCSSSPAYPMIANIDTSEFSSTYPLSTIRSPQISESKLWTIITAFTLLTTYDEETESYGILPYMDEFIDERLESCLIKFLNSDVFKIGRKKIDYKDDKTPWLADVFRSDPRYIEAFSRILQDEYYAFEDEKNSNAKENPFLDNLKKLRKKSRVKQANEETLASA